MGHKSFREESKRDYGRVTDAGLNKDELQLGALLRIADATEVMAQNHVKLQNERDMYARWYKDSKARGERMARRIAALQGVITKMKKARGPRVREE